MKQKTPSSPHSGREEWFTRLNELGGLNFNGTPMPPYALQSNIKSVSKAT